MTMLRSLLLLHLILLVVFLRAQPERLEIEGTLQIGSTAETNPAPGSIRWTGVDFEGFNGAQWTSLTGRGFGSVTDIDGNQYMTIIIGTKEWMVQNLQTSKYKNGSPIPFLTSNAHWNIATEGAFCWYEHNQTTAGIYGNLYNHLAMHDSRGLCPTGWHVPTSLEWNQLGVDLGGLALAGGKMKEAGFLHWNSPNTGGTNQSGFTGLPGGGRTADGAFEGLGFLGRWWTKSNAPYISLGFFKISTESEELTYVSLIPTFREGSSVRCVKD